MIDPRKIFKLAAWLFIPLAWLATATGHLDAACLSGLSGLICSATWTIIDEIRKGR